MSGSIRAYRAGDEGPIVELSNRSLAPYAGWMQRTVEYWQWSILRRPGVSPADVLVVHEELHEICPLVGSRQAER